MRLLRLPAAQPTMQSGTLRRILIAPGNPVSPGEPIVQIEHEHGSMQLEADFSGTLVRFLLLEGQSASVGEPLAEFSDGEDLSSAPLKISPTSEVIFIRMPQAGQSMEEGTIVEWRVKEGDRIELGQVIFEIETDKATIEIEADRSGRLARILVQAGDTVPVKTPIACLAETDADVEAFLASQRHGEPHSTTPTVAHEENLETSAVSFATSMADNDALSVHASPAARKLADQLRVDLQKVGAGSGPHGRILSTDVQRAADSTALPGGRRPISRMRKAIARNVQVSKQTVPHFYVRQTVEAGALLDFYRARKENTGCSLNDVVLFGFSKAIAEFPAFRSRLDGDNIVERPTANIGIVVGLDEGLVVPVVSGADRLSLEQLVQETRRIIERARAGTVEGAGESTVAISNLGMFGVEEFSAIINPPDVAILAVGAVREGVVVKNGVTEAAPLVGLTLSCDHRLIDGALAGRFMARLKEILESL